MRLRSQFLIFASFALSMVQQATADTLYGYALGVPLQTTVVPGTLVSIDAKLLNTGSAPIVFAPSFPGGPPSVQGGSLPSAGVNSSGDWSILQAGFSFGDFFGQFAGVTVLPGDTFSFTVGTFLAPQDQPLGSSATPSVNVSMTFTDTIWGNLLGICPGACDYSNAPTMVFTLGDVFGASDVVYFEGVVVDVENRTPEPQAWLMLSTALLITLARARFGSGIGGGSDKDR